LLEVDILFFVFHKKKKIIAFERVVLENRGNQ